MGRYNMLALHMFLLTNRFKYVEASNKDDAASVSQEVFDLFLLDIERGLRDIGFADTSTHKRKKKLARSYYALIEEFDSPLQTSDHPALFSAVGARYFDKLEDGDVSKAAENLGQYMIDTHRVLASQSDTDIISGSFHWQEEEKK